MSPSDSLRIGMISRASAGFFALLCLAVVANGALAQQDPDPGEGPAADTAGAEWNSEVTGKISASQAAYKDWQEGGLNSLSLSTSLDAATERQGKNWEQAYDLRLAIGFIDQENQKLRKSEDQIRLQSNLQYRGDGFFRQFNPTVAADLRTQFAIGFDYSDNPYPEGNPRAGREPPVRTSSFFAPATITESLGLTYNPYEQLSLRFGAASKQTIIREPDFRVLYGVDEDNLVRAEAGAEFAANLDQRLSENIRYQSQLNLFLALNQLENPPDGIWENVINMEVNNWLTTDLQFVALFDKDTSDAIQLKEVISVGVTFTLL